MKLLADKVILITGAGRGIGRAHAIELSRLGARIVVNDLGAAVDGVGADRSPADDVVAEIAASNGRAVASYDDISRWTGASGAVETAIRAFGRLDGLVNNAGNMRLGPLADMDEADFDALTAVHLKGGFACTIHALRHWRDAWAQGRRQGGAIVNTISETMLAGTPHYAGYAAMKAGLSQLTMTGSREAAAFGVTVNAYAPRAFTRMSSRPVAHPERPSPRDAGNTSPLVAWLLSDRARHVTGQLFQTVGGGIGRCDGWTTGPVFQPDDGLRFAVEEVEALMRTQMFPTAYHGRPFEPMPGE